MPQHRPVSAPPSGGDSAHGETSWKWAGRIADLAAIGGLVIALVSGKPVWVALALAGLLALITVWLWRKGYKPASSSIGTIATIVALGALVLLADPQLLHQAIDKSISGNTSNSSSPAPVDSPSASSSSANSSVASTPASGPKLIVKQDITLVRNAAVDLDRADPQPVVDQKAATNGFDMYHDWGQVRSDNIQTAENEVYAYTGGSADTAYAACKEAIRVKTPYSSGSLSSAGTAFCFKTSGGRIAYASVKNIQSDYTAILSVRVWEK